MMYSGPVKMKRESKRRERTRCKCGGVGREIRHERKGKKIKKEVRCMRKSEIRPLKKEGVGHE